MKNLNRRYDKNYANLERELKQALHQMPVPANNAHIQATILLTGKEACLKQERTRISYLCFLRKQLRFIAWKVWIVQGVLLLFISLLLSRLFNSAFMPRQLIRLFSCLSVLIFMTALPLLYRSVRYRMQEVETAARFSGIKLLLARLLIIGIGDICLLTGVFFAAVIKEALPTGSIVFCLCFPFLLAGCGGLYMLGHFPPRRFFAGSLLYCAFLVTAFGLLPGQDLFLLQPSPPAMRIALCALLLAFCIQQLRYLIKVSSYEEMQLS